VRVTEGEDARIRALTERENARRLARANPLIPPKLLTPTETVRIALVHGLGEIEASERLAEPGPAPSETSPRTSGDAPGERP
jgi:hypothetical protein